ncbi:MAG: SEL1-like repeat protein [Proteobacteria bacterium]|nr:SEL1-like repeat protein [Pseudomonadota bacterium]
MKPFLLLGVLAWLMAASPARADFADAIQAYDGGDYATAFAESLAAAKRGDADAQYMAGFLYMRGQGTRRDSLRAYQWFALAARQGDEFAADALTELAARLSAEQISQAETWAREWRPTSGE